MKRKVVVLGGGTGSSTLLRGLKEFPLDITAIVSVCDDGRSTGVLREEFNIPAVGDITKVLMAMSTESKGVKDLFNYRFDNNSSIGNHSIKNLIMTALLEMKGDFAHSLPILCDLLDVKGKLLPLTEDNVDLIGVTKEGYEIISEAEITESKRKIKDLKYSKKITVTPRVLEEIKKADLIIFSSGSLLTSVMPHIIVPEIQDAINASKEGSKIIINNATVNATNDFKRDIIAFENNNGEIVINDITVTNYMRGINNYNGEVEINGGSFSELGDILIYSENNAYEIAKGLAELSI
mgnify:CR=1 FL=1